METMEKKAPSLVGFQMDANNALFVLVPAFLGWVIGGVALSMHAGMVAGLIGSAAVIYQTARARDMGKKWTWIALTMLVIATLV